MMLKVLVTIGILQFVTMLFQLVRTKVLALCLGPDLLGPMGVIDKLLAVIVQVVSLSLPFTALRFLPARWSSDPAGGEFRDLFARMRNLLFALVLAATAGALLITAFRPGVWGVRLLPYRGALTAGILTLPVLAAIPFLQNAIAGRLEQNRAMLVGFLNAIVLAAAAAGVWWRGLAGYYVVYAVLGLGVVGFATRLVTRDRTGSPLPRPARLAIKLPRPVWRFSAALIIIHFISPYAVLFVQYRVLRDHGVTAAGWMQAAWGIAFSVRGLLGMSHSVFLTPNVNREGSPAERMAWANRFQATFCLLTGLLVPPILLFPELVVRLLYSSAFLPGATFLALFVVAEVSYLLSGAYQSLILAFDHVLAQVGITLGAQLAVILAASRLIGPLGILGAGLAGFAAPLFLAASTMMFLRRTYGLRVPRRIAARVAWLLAGLVLAGLAGAEIKGALWPSLGLKAAAYGLIVGSFILLMSVEERTAVRRTILAWHGRLFPTPR